MNKPQILNLLEKIIEDCEWLESDDWEELIEFIKKLREVDASEIY